MEQLRPVSRKKDNIPCGYSLVTLLLPSAGRFSRNADVRKPIQRMWSSRKDIKNKAENELMNIVTLFLGLTVGATANAETFLSPDTLKIIALGLIAFSMGSAAGVIFGKIMCKLTGSQ